MAKRNSALKDPWVQIWGTLFFVSAGWMLVRPAADSPVPAVPHASLPTQAVPVTVDKSVLPVLVSKKAGLWVVDASGGTGSDTKSIAAAVANARTGDTVFVRKGTYSEPITVSKDLLLKGEGQGETLLRTDQGPVIRVLGGKVKIEGLTVEQTVKYVKDVNKPHAGIAQFGGQVRLAGVKVVSETTAALLLGLGNPRLEAEHIDVSGHFGLSQLDGTFSCSDCAFHHGGVGIQSESNHGEKTALQLVRTRCFKNRSFGLHLWGPVTANAEGSQFDENEGSGIGVVKGASFAAKDVSASRNLQSGLFVEGAKARFERLSVLGSGKTGVLVTNGAEVSLTESSISQGEKLGLFAEKASDVRLDRVEMSGNRAGTFIAAKDGTKVMTFGIDIQPRQPASKAPKK